MQYDFPSVEINEKKLLLQDGKYVILPNEYTKPINFSKISEFYRKLLETTSRNLEIGEDPSGFTYFKLGFICYIGIVCNTKSIGKFNTLKKKYPNNKFSKEYIQKRIENEIKLLNNQEYIPVDVVSHNLHEIRGLNAKVTDNIDALMQLDDEEKWDEQFDRAGLHLKKIYVASRLTKFILDNTKFYNPQFLETLTLNKDRTFNPHRGISKIVKIYRNDFKKEKPDIEFTGNSYLKMRGDKEYFEILIKIFIENALKYSDIKTIGPKVKIIENNNTIEVEVHSYGKLIPSEEKKHIFFKGFRSSINKTKIEGTGFGLYNAKKLIEKFGGDIELITQQVSVVDNYEIGWNIFKLFFPAESPKN